MRGINKKMVLLPILLLSLLASLPMVKPTFAEGAVLYVDPVMNGPGDFSVNIMIADVIDLYGYQFKLVYDPNVVMATAISVGDFFPTPPGYVVWKKEIAGDYAGLAVTRPYGSPSGKSGSGRLATIDFIVVGPGSSYLRVEADKLTKPTAELIPHTTLWGYYSDVAAIFEGYLTRRRNINRPEHNLYKMSEDEDIYQTIMAGVGNGGTGPVHLAVTWFVTGIEGTESKTVDAIIGAGEEMSLSYDLVAEPGSFAVQLAIEYDSNGDGTLDAVGTFESGEGGGGGTYEFTVVE